ncbi:redoxin family protein [Eggerthellaceae bacterium zg-1084]|uniref:Redoxin family protein n=1 Tax=Berryella wangjianweii TaxID=2734634 RepID=A0A6M8J1A8_9ACTN|nr:cytochrome c biogenesis protein/redoxin [Berryella wangjianweii]NPD31621.1 redoxin family protein [Berryella wangjianweii]NPD32884.1 redoxin family protein [Eggerthellaceae bacterium zg-997]QKF07760.1 redoxin family protein [Berryella wangjianweii]
MDLSLIASAAVAGLLSFFSPCILPLLPVYLGVLTTDADQRQLGPLRRSANTLAFVLGISFVFVALGAGSSALGAAVSSPYLAIALGLVVFAFGLHLAGALSIPFLKLERRADLGKISGKGVAGAFVLGLAFSFGWTPCVGPILGTILALAADQGSVAAGAGLLLVYALGLSLPFVCISVASGFFLAKLKALHRHLGAIQRIGGALIAIMGLWMVFSQVNDLMVRNVALQDQAAYEAELAAQGQGSSDADATRLIAGAQGVKAGDADPSGVSSAWKNVALTDLDGQVHRLSEFRGRPLYFEFWGSWCTSCVEDLDQLTEVYRRHRDSNVQITSLVVPNSFGEKSPEDFVAWARDRGVEIPVLMDTKGSLSSYLGLNAFPTSVFVSSDGTIARIRVGAIEPAELDRLLSELS